MWETYASVFDDFEAAFELLCVLCSILASNEDFNGGLAVLEGLKVGSCEGLANRTIAGNVGRMYIPFFLVVTICMESWVMTKTVEGNS